MIALRPDAVVAPTASAPAADAETELEQGLAALGRARELGGDRERLLARLAAADRLKRVHTLHPDDAGPAGHEAALAAGAELGALGILDEACAQLELALELAPEEALAALTELELAHLLRRAGETSAARERYARVELDPALGLDAREVARLWRGRLAAEEGDLALAERLWTGVAGTSDDPARSIEAHDRLARLCIARDDLEGAAGWIEAARVRWSDASAAVTPRGDRVRRALMRMGAVVELRLAVFEREYGRPDTR